MRHLIFIASLISICLLPFTSFATDDFNLESEKQRAAIFKSKLLAYQLDLRKGDVSSASDFLEDFVILAKEETAHYQNKKDWIEANICSELENADRIKYVLKGYTAKQNELLAELKMLNRKNSLDQKDIERIKNLGKWFHETMETSIEYAKDVQDTCK